ncbi:MAG: glycosyltransferase family 4 protein [Flavobacteriales bacterium]|nr:glycosyltransferase family 4 protein [Flavobacteriales bacterium]
MKKVLIISYYWPPAGGGGVQRWLKMSKYLPENGWQPIIYTPSNGEAPVIDESLLAEIHPDLKTVRTKIWEPYSFYKLLTGRKRSERVYSGFISSKKESFAQKLSVFIRGNFFIPDARKFWIRPSIRFLKKYLRENPVDAIISTGPPHSMHRIALGVAPPLGIPWIADFRDPWTRIDFYDQLRLTKWGDRRHRRMEAEVLRDATKIVTVSPSWASDFKDISGRNDIKIITNGYDPADFGQIEQRTEDRFVLCHVGSMNKDRNPYVLWDALAELIKDHGFASKLCIQLIGQVDHSILESLDSKGLTPYLEHIPFVAHSEVPAYLQAASLLLLPVNDTPNSMGVVPGKLFEYMGSGKPILAIGPEKGDTAAFIRESGSGSVIGYSDLDRAIEVVKRTCENRSEGLDHQQGSISRFSRKQLAQQYTQLLDSLLNPTLKNHG